MIMNCPFKLLVDLEILMSKESPSDVRESAYRNLKEYINSKKQTPALLLPKKDK